MYLELGSGTYEVEPRSKRHTACLVLKWYIIYLLGIVFARLSDLARFRPSDYTPPRDSVYLSVFFACNTAWAF